MSQIGGDGGYDRMLRKKGSTEAILYEIIARKTADESMVQHHRTAGKAHVSSVTYQVSRK
jgi:IS5 family transposase